jgi:hypothetical protein
MVAHTLGDAKEKLVRCLEPPPKVARLLVADGGSDTLDSLCGAFTNTGSAALPSKGEVDGVLIHRMVEKAIVRLEQRRAVTVSPELERIIKGWIVGAQGARVNGTETKASVVIPLGEETVEQDLVVAGGSDEGHSTVSRSPFFSRAAGWAFAWWFLAFLFCFCVGLVPHVAHTLRDAKEKLVRYLEPSPKVARLLVADGGSDTLDSLCGGAFTNSPALPSKGEADGVFIHRMVEKAIIRLEQRRAVAVSPELECIIKGWIVGAQGARESLTNPVPVVSSAHQPWQRWALVVYRPEDHNVVYQRVCILLARWREMAREIAVEETVTATEDTADPEGHRRRKNRPNKAARQRRRNRVAMEEKEREESAMQESLLAFAARTRTLPALSVLPLSVIPLAMSLGMDRKSSPGSHLS